MFGRRYLAATATAMVLALAATAGAQTAPTTIRVPLVPR